MGFLDRFTNKAKPATSSGAAQAQTRAQNPYQGVEIVSNPANCCQAAKDLSGKRFLCASAPFLPLKDCDKSDCRCSYKRYKDRRTDSRRAGDVAFDMLGQYASDERRTQQFSGRRETD